MAPSRRKPCKRTNAAFKALEPFGFPKSTISKTIKAMLKAYGGEGGWPFIEEDSYKLVLERILEDQEEKAADQKKEENVELETGGSTVCSQNADNVNRDANFEGGSINWRDIPIARCATAEPTVPVIRRRPPCYGWISESEDESEETSDQ